MCERVAIVGGRLRLWYNRTAAVREIVFRLVEETPVDATVVSGASPGGGVDAWAEEAARKYGRKLHVYPPDLSNGTPFAKACFERNQLIVNNCDLLIAVVAPNSKGTFDTIRRAVLASVPVKIIRPLPASWYAAGGPV